MYDRGNCVSLSPLIINQLGRSKVHSSDKIMTMEREVEEEEEVCNKEEEETLSEDKEEHYVEARSIIKL